MGAEGAMAGGCKFLYTAEIYILNIHLYNLKIVQRNVFSRTSANFIRKKCA